MDGTVTGPLTDNHRVLIGQASCGNADAAAFLTTIVEVLHFWDDLIDDDRALSNTEINERMWQALVLLPRNRFYREHLNDLSPILAQAVLNWMTANTMENKVGGGGLDLPIAFIIRSSYVDLISQVALICGGFQWAQQITLAARRSAHGETYPGYLANLDKQFADAVTLKAG